MPFTVDRQRLRSDEQHVKLFASPNCGPALVTPEFLIIHFTAGTSFDNACAWLTNPRAKASAHIVIGRDGEVAQLVEFGVRAWHAGQSEWGHNVGTQRPQYKNLNSHSIGIELVNAGPLNKHADGTWRTLSGNKSIHDSDVVMAMHKHTTWPWHGWHAYTPEQLSTLLDVGHAIVDEYPSIKHVLGHDDIAPSRKCDPGAAFPMISLRSQLLGRADEG